MRTEPSGGANPRKEKCMTYPNQPEEYKDLLPNFTERAKKALGDRPQTRFDQKQATFDNYGLARPKTRRVVDSGRG